MQKPTNILKMRLMMPKEQENHNMLSSNKLSNTNHMIKMKHKLYQFSSIIRDREILKTQVCDEIKNILSYFFRSFLF